MANARYFAKNDDAAKNGSFIIVYAQTYSRYMNGDYMGSMTHRNGLENQSIQVKSEGFIEYTRKQMKQFGF